MVSVQDEQLVQCVDDRGIDLLHLVGQPKGHPDEVLCEGPGRIRVEQRQASGTLCDVGDHCWQLGHEKHRSKVQLSRILRIKRVIVVGGHASHSRLQNGHRMPTCGESGEECFEVLMQ